MSRIQRFQIFRTDFSKKSKPVQCEVVYIKHDEPCVLEFNDELLGKINASGIDLFDALCALRKTLEEQGILLICSGAMVNVYPSALSRQMSGGKKAYIHTLGKNPTRENVISIFCRADIDDIGTIEEQENFMAKWRLSVKGE